ncbi:MAG: hypothetical protein ACK5TK_01705 [Betaproteobacteria bacterium]
MNSLNRSTCLIAAALVFASGVAGAASNGTLGSSSTGSLNVTANAPPPPRLVQVLNLDDLTLNNSSPVPHGGYGSKGTSDNFCVVETTGGAVSLQVAISTGPAESGLWRLNATDSSGATVPMNLVLTRPDLTTTGLSGALNPQNNGTNAFTATLGAGVARGSSSECGTLGDNMRVSLGINELAANGRTYSAIVTFVVTPN